MSLSLTAKRQIIVIETGKEETQEKSFSLWSTTTTTAQIVLASDKPEEVYINWIVDMNGFEDDRQEHIDDLRNWLAGLDAEGWTPAWSVDCGNKKMRARQP